MTKMVIGRGCCDKYDITRDDMKEAKRRIKQDFAFIGNLSKFFYYHSFQGKISIACSRLELKNNTVGLQERWNTSVELFHLKYGGKLFHEELSVRRKAAKEGQRQEMEKAVKTGKKTGVRMNTIVCKLGGLQ